MKLSEGQTRMTKAWMIFGLIALLAIVTGSVVAYGTGDHDEGPAHDPEAGTGEWQVTSVSQNFPNDCHTRGEICMEWCVRTPNGHDAGTGELCCVKDGICRSLRP